MKPCFETATRLARAIRNGRLSSVEATQLHLERISRLNGPLNALVVVNRDGALKAARAPDRARAKKTRLGPLPGVLAIAIHTMGALGKLFSEVVENIDLKPVDGITASGGSWWQIVRFAVVPQVLSNFASYALLRFEINVRGASIMGFVGAGGIGQDLIEAIRKFYFTDVSAILLLIILAVMLIDYGTERLRHALLSLEHGR